MMEEKGIPMTGPEWEAALLVLRQLSSEIDAGNRALARHDIKEFAKHIAVQEHLCDLLIEANILKSPEQGRTLGYAADLRFAIPSNSPYSFQSPKEAFSVLDHQKRVYALLLERAKHFVHLLLTYYQSHHGYSANGPVPVEATTWSDEG